MDGLRVAARPDDDDEPNGSAVSGGPPEIAELDPEPYYAGHGTKSLARRAWEERHPEGFVKPGKVPGGGGKPRTPNAHSAASSAGSAGSGPATKPAPEIAIFGSPKGRGGAKASPKVKSAPWVANALQAAHLMLAAKIGHPEFSIDAEEANLLADAIAGVFDHYKIEVLSKESGPWANLAGVVAMVYGPRFAMVIMAEMKKAKGAKPASSAAGQPSSYDPTAPNDPALYDPTIYGAAGQI